MKILQSAIILISIFMGVSSCISLRDNVCDVESDAFDLNACLPLCQKSTCGQGLTPAVTVSGCQCLTCEEIEASCGPNQFFESCQCLPLNGTKSCADGDQCTISCESGYDDCNMDLLDGCEASLLTSATHCGACGQLCGTGNCVEGQCEPGVLVEGEYIKVATVDEEALYFLDDIGSSAVLKKVSLLGDSTPTTLVSGQSDSIPDDGMTIDDTHVYWGNFGTDDVRRVSKSGGSAEILVSDPVNSGGMIVVSGKVIYGYEDVMNAEPGSPRSYRVMSVPTSGGRSTVIASKRYGIDALASDGTYVYWASGSYEAILNRASLNSSNQSGTELITRAGHLAAQGTCLDGDQIYWGLSGGDGRSGEVLRLSLSGNSANVSTTLGQGYEYVYSLVCNSSHVYWKANKDGVRAVWRVAKGSDDIELVTGTEDVSGDTILVNETSLYLIGNREITAVPLN